MFLLFDERACTENEYSGAQLNLEEWELHINTLELKVLIP